MQRVENSTPARQQAQTLKMEIEEIFLAEYLQRAIKSSRNDEERERAFQLAAHFERQIERSKMPHTDRIGRTNFRNKLQRK